MGGGGGGIKIITSSDNGMRCPTIEEFLFVQFMLIPQQ